LSVTELSEWLQLMLTEVAQRQREAEQAAAEDAERARGVEGEREPQRPSDKNSQRASAA
jgi:hypothetical protein